MGRSLKVPRPLLYIPFQTGGSYSPADGASGFIGCSGAAPATAADFQKIYVPDGSWYITEIMGSIAKGGAETSTSETSTLSVVKNTSTTVGTVGTVTHPTANTAWTFFTFRDLSLGPLVRGEYFELKLVHPTWSTNPTVVFYFGTITLERR